MKKNILFFILGGIFFSCISVYATIYYDASQINYKNTTLDHAIDDLYTTQNTTVTNLQGQISTLQTTNTNLNNQLNAPIDYYIRVESLSKSYSSTANIQNTKIPWMSKYAKVKYGSLEKNSYASSCVFKGNRKSDGIWSDISQGTTVNLSDYYNFFVAAKSTTDGTQGYCIFQLQFSK